MKSRILQKLGLLLLAVSCLAATRVSAIVLDFNVSGVGTYAPASAANNDTDATAAVNALVNWYNGGANPNGGAIVYTLDAGSGIPGTLPTPVLFAVRNETAPFSDATVPPYTYILGKYGNVAVVFYIGNLAPGSYSLPGTFNGNSLSHELFFTSPGTSVPDSGMTMALLGCTLLGLEFLRRKFRRA